MKLVRIFTQHLLYLCSFYGLVMFVLVINPLIWYILFIAVIYEFGIFMFHTIKGLFE